MDTQMMSAIISTAIITLAFTVGQIIYDQTKFTARRCFEDTHNNPDEFHLHYVYLCLSSSSRQRLQHTLSSDRWKKRFHTWTLKEGTVAVHNTESCQWAHDNGSLCQVVIKGKACLSENAFQETQQHCWRTNAWLLMSLTSPYSPARTYTNSTPIMLVWWDYNELVNNGQWCSTNQLLDNHIQTHGNTQVCAKTYIHTHTHTHAHTCAQTHTHTDTHSSAQIFVANVWYDTMNQR